MEVSVIETRERETVEKALSIKEQADAIVVIDQASYNAANEINKAAYAEKKAFHVWFDPIDEASKKSRQAVIAQGKKIDEPLDYVIKATGRKAAEWMRAEQARIAEEKRKAEGIARKEAEEAQIAAAEITQRPSNRARLPPSTIARCSGSAIALAIFMRSSSKSLPGQSVPMMIFSGPRSL